MKKTILLRCPVMPLETISLDVKEVSGGSAMELIAGQSRYEGKLFSLKKSLFITMLDGEKGPVITDHTQEVLNNFLNRDTVMLPSLGFSKHGSFIWISPQAITYYGDVMFNKLIGLAELLEMKRPVL